MKIPKTKDWIRLVADGCGEQSKNTTLMARCCYWLTKRSPPHVNKYVPSRRSFIFASRVFAQIEKVVKSKESIVSPNEYFQIYEKFGQINRLGYDCPVLDFKKVLPT